MAGKDFALSEFFLIALSLMASITSAVAGFVIVGLMIQEYGKCVWIS
jgi:hypothetical protein